ncbi:hypothetical protein NADFUDRAFT_51283 [Nadsonia fulvescens var. elongata DSM 6958]|uniref:Uncharacterized protein n=1 Tax=Nadsonia fulvescens var. elongata DSM 6958 TaxID=857566 RepID=A0A1E3PKQ9_9ASCO|nr:hypothetical protein NADFUDRAFT_51283 [Nadsonia fulvescens var. elongata DSM 6958]
MMRASQRTSIKSVLLRLLLYYIGFLAIFQCPLTSPLNESSPALCSPIHRSVNAVRPLVEASYQYVEPHMAACREYVAPLQPYVEPFHVFHTTYIAPAIVAAERVLNQVQTNQKLVFWRSHVGAYLAPYHERVRALVGVWRNHLNKLLEPYLCRIQPIVNKSSQYVVQISTTASQLISEKIYPTVEAVVVKCREVGLKFYFGTLQPFVTNKAMPYINRTILPVVKLYTGKLIHYGHFYGCKMVDYMWILIDKAMCKAKAEYIPKAWDFWKEKVNKQLVRVMDHIYSVAYTEKKVDIDSSVSTTSSIEVVKPTENAVLISIPNSTEDTKKETESNIQSVETKIVITTTETENEAVSAIASSSVVTSLPTQDKVVKPNLFSTLESYATLIDSTYSSAFSNLNTTLENEKNILLKGSSSIFTKKLQSMQQELTQALRDMNALVDTIIPEANNTNEVLISEEEISDVFKVNADLLRSKAMDIRRMSELLAHEAVEKTEDLRGKTLDVLDEFSEVVSSQLGKFIMDYSLANPSEGSGDNKHQKNENKSKDAFSPWVSYSSLLRQLEHNRHEITDFAIPMDDVNLFLREVQETANFLAREVGSQFQGLRGKAHFAFQERAKVVASAIKDEPHGQDWPVDAEIYDEVEEPNDTVTRTLTQFVTSVKQSDLPTQSELPVESLSSSGKLENHEESVLNENNVPFIEPSSLEYFGDEGSITLNATQESEDKVSIATEDIKVEQQQPQDSSQTVYQNVQTDKEERGDHATEPALNRNETSQIELEYAEYSISNNNNFTSEPNKPEALVIEVGPRDDMDGGIESVFDSPSGDPKYNGSEPVVPHTLQDDVVIEVESYVVPEIVPESESDDNSAGSVISVISEASNEINSKNDSIIAVTEPEVEQRDNSIDHPEAPVTVVDTNFFFKIETDILNTPINEVSAFEMGENLSEQDLESPISENEVVSEVFSDDYEENLIITEALS